MQACVGVYLFRDVNTSFREVISWVFQMEKDYLNKVAFTIHLIFTTFFVYTPVLNIVSQKVFYFFFSFIL